MSQAASSYGAPPQVNRRDSQDQLQMMTQRMKQMSIQSPMYQGDGYGGPRSPYDHMQSSYVSSSGSERGGYYQAFYTPSAAPPSNSYSSVVSRGKDGTVGKLCAHCTCTLLMKRTWEFMSFFYFPPPLNSPNCHLRISFSITDVKT